MNITSISIPRFFTTMVFTVTLMGALLPAPTSLAGEWIPDVAASCAVWNPSPQAGETIRFEGECKQGLAHGQGLVKWYIEDKLQSVFKGTYRGGKMHGHGVMKFPDGSRYEGTFLRGQRSGQGTRTWSNGDFFEGTYVSNRRHGIGVMDFASGFRFAGNYQNGKPHGAGDCYTSARGSWRCHWIDGKLQR